jgi:hypothetical protein
MILKEIQIALKFETLAKEMNALKGRRVKAANKTRTKTAGKDLCEYRDVTDELLVLFQDMEKYGRDI